MQLTCEQPDLLKGVQAVTRAISTRTTMPILSNILLQSTKDGIKLAATDLELGIQTIVPASVKKGGALTLPARLLSEICRRRRWSFEWKRVGRRRKFVVRRRYLRF